jgi:DNA-binding MarR family transcriptional regulator
MTDENKRDLDAVNIEAPEAVQKTNAKSVNSKNGVEGQAEKAEAKLTFKMRLLLEYAARNDEDGAAITLRAWNPTARILIERGWLTLRRATQRREYHRVFLTPAGRAALEVES